MTSTRRLRHTIGTIAAGVTMGVTALTAWAPAAHAAASDLRITADSDVESNSGTNPMGFTVSRDAATGIDCTFAATIGFSGTSTANADDLANEGVEQIFRMKANATSGFYVMAQIVGDTIIEPDETFVATIRGVAHQGDPACTVSRVARRAVGRIITDDIGVSVADASLTEGNSGTANMQVRLSLSSPAKGAETVRFTTASVTATPPSDYTNRDFVVTFAAGQTTRDIPVVVKGDTTVEPNETFTVTLTNPVGLIVTDALSFGTITNDDSAGLSLPVVTVTEPPHPSSAAVPIVLTRSVPAATDCVIRRTVTLAADDTAAAADVGETLPHSQDFVVAANSTTREIQSVTTNSDTLVETPETYTVTIEGVPGGGLPACEVNPAAATRKVTILDLPPRRVSIGDASKIEGNSGTSTMLFPITLSQPAVGTESVTLFTLGGETASEGSDFNPRFGVVVSFNAGQTSRNVAITIKGDTEFEDDETFSVLFESAVGLTMADSHAIGTILNDD